MLTLTLDRTKAGWRYRQAGYALNNFEVTRKMDWEDPDAQPLWHVMRNGKLMHTTEKMDDAMNFAEATYELENAER